MNKSGFVAVVGRPNVGKSTLLNRIIGYKVLIESDKPQATRNRIHCAYNDERGQIVFVDTPGIHKPQHLLGEYLVERTRSALQDADLILFLVEPDIEIGKGDRHIARMLQEVDVPIILVVNKLDSVSSTRLIQSLHNYAELFAFEEYIPLSAKEGTNLDRLLDLVFSYLEEGPQYYPEDILTDRSEDFVMAEMIREKVFAQMREEIPYAVAVEIIEKNETADELYLAADIIVERRGQKEIVVGKNGKTLDRIRHLSVMDIRDLVGKRVELDLHVRVREDWRNTKRLLKDYGYKEDF